MYMLVLLRQDNKYNIVVKNIASRWKMPVMSARRPSVNMSEVYSSEYRLILY